MRKANLLVMMAACVLGGCRTMNPLLSTPAVSMEISSAKSGTHTRELGPVREKYCRGDDAISSTDGTVGLMDEVILKAQKAKNASYIKEAKFMSDGVCVELSGIAIE